ncbi:hypothetical protein SAMN04489727_6749 [Amycolatopsis tolypomycina]|uniref:Peptidase inhibitor family I36 n=1 Tax=Amycolatopsis tolypomycina TaxID=208445 RepID=A0A1H4YKP4_9PSEU|nr:hypothetical protein [Amycolatopsis tolypomycina]SED17658.1 hypothetical protein SAMN04489727_6749 [Amycolatopsis tolypomycina]
MLKKVIAALGLAGAALVSVALPASAQTQAAPNCQFGSSYGVVEGSAPVTPITGGAAVGSAQVCRDSNYDYWGFAIYNSPMTVSQWAQVYLNRYRDGILVDTITCDTPGGNDRIGPGQTRCWTPKLTGLSGRWTFQTYSEKYSSHTGSLLAAGHTTIVR